LVGSSIWVSIFIFSKHLLGLNVNLSAEILVLYFIVERGSQDSGQLLFFLLYHKIVPRWKCRDLFGTMNCFFGNSLHIQMMENPYHKELRRILRQHKEITQVNNRDLMVILAKLEELEKTNNLHNCKFMALLSKKINELTPWK